MSDERVSMIAQARKAAEEAQGEGFKDILHLQLAMHAKYEELEAARIDTADEYKVNLPRFLEPAGVDGVLLSKVAMVFSDAERLRKAVEHNVNLGTITVVRPKDKGNRKVLIFVKPV